jgi:transposase
MAVPSFVGVLGRSPEDLPSGRPQARDRHLKFHEDRDNLCCLVELCMRAAPLMLPDTDREILEKWVRSSTTKAGLVTRARIVLSAADGVAHAETARRFAISRQTVINWRARYESGGVAGLFDEERSGRPRTLDRDKLITVTLTPPPAKYAVTHWSSRLLARHLGVGYGTVARVWREHGVQPWRPETFKFSTDPELVASSPTSLGCIGAARERGRALCR